MKLSWLTKSKVSVEVLDEEILVTMQGTSFSIVYEKTKHNQLIASSFSGRKIQDERCSVSFPLPGRPPTIRRVCLAGSNRNVTTSGIQFRPIGKCTLVIPKRMQSA